MATGYAWLLNLDAERELAVPSYRAAPEMEARIAALRARMELLLGPDDKVMGLHTAAELAACTRVFAFCPTPTALERIRQAQLVPPPAPSLAILQRVNSRAFCAELGQSLPGARYVRSMAALNEVLTSRAEDCAWLLKRDFGFAGRERMRALGSGLDVPTLGFARNTFARGEGLQVEPLVARSHDFAQHGYVSRTGELSLGAPHAQDCDARGVWQRSRALAPGELSAQESSQLAASCREAGEALVAAGYFGPFGVDAYRYEQPRLGPAFQPRSEINARFSMGYPRALLAAAIARDEDDARP